MRIKALLMLAYKFKIQLVCFKFTIGLCTNILLLKVIKLHGWLAQYLLSITFKKISVWHYKINNDQTFSFYPIIFHNVIFISFYCITYNLVYNILSPWNSPSIHTKLTYLWIITFLVTKPFMEYLTWIQ